MRFENPRNAVADLLVNREGLSYSCIPSNHVRSYSAQVSSRIEQIASNYIVNNLGAVRYGELSYPIYRVSNFIEYDNSKLLVFLSGGVHGDEPAGTFALLNFLDDGFKKLDVDFQFVAYPCVNPSGFEANSLATISGANLNRLFGCKGTSPEVELIQNDLAKLNLRFDIAMDMHECAPDYVGEGYTEKDNPRAAWIFESQRNIELRIGRKLVDSLPSADVCDWPHIYHDINDRGVINFLPETTNNPIYAQQTSLDGYMFENYSNHSFTTETPTGWDINKRVSVQQHFFIEALRAISDRK